MEIAALEHRMTRHADELDALIEQHQRMVFRIAWSVLRNHHDAEDAAQETFVRLWRTRDKLAGVADLKAWIARMAWNVTMDRVRQGSGRAAVEVDDAAAAVRLHSARGGTAEQLAAGAEMQRLLQSLMQTLPAKLKDVIVLSTVEELEHEEIAQVLDMKPETVRMRLFQARQLLREKLARVLKRQIP